MKKLYLLLTLLVLAFSSCTKEMVFPVASGRPYEAVSYTHLRAHET